MNSIIDYIKATGFLVQFLLFMFVIFLIKIKSIKNSIKKSDQGNKIPTEQQRLNMDNYLSKNKMAKQPRVNLIERSCQSDNSLILFGAGALLAGKDETVNYDGTYLENPSTEESGSVSKIEIAESVYHSSQSNDISDANYCNSDSSSDTDLGD
ncbi:hypothetical protein EIJ81_00425 (plasmid) [Aliivibrio salmonicida]|uniref:hypothetical protein n=2 Tax=Aliivibrio salmonicida TaxID=40269 RepID=UPI000F6FD952|nr:hypothetical protein [Aliivibrio salmonicida]AZL83364.1 hypothetical protein EIJ81_00425 [Aliivibrio salmonicida]